MTDPADYLAFAWCERRNHPGSRKALWCSPILASPHKPFGIVMSREQIREQIVKWQGAIQRRDKLSNTYLNMDQPLVVLESVGASTPAVWFDGRRDESTCLRRSRVSARTLPS